MADHKKLLSRLLHSEEESQVSKGLKKLDKLAKKNPAIVEETVGYPEIDQHGWLSPAPELEAAPMAMAISLWTLCWRAKYQAVCPKKLGIAGYFWDCFFRPIFSPKWLSALTELNHVIVQRTPLYQQHWSSLCQLSQIETLELRDSSLFHLPDTITTLENLQEIEVISWNLKTLPTTFAPLHKLRRLKIKCDGQALKQFPEGITALENLEELILPVSRITAIPPAIKGLRSLRTLEITGPFTEIPSELTSLNGLQRLCLHGRFSSLPAGFTEQQNLCHLSLSGELESLPEDFTNLKNLEYLSVKAKLKTLPSNFGLLDQLSDLRLAGNKLTDLPSSFAQLQQLERLTLDGWNRFRHIPEPLFQLKHLKFLAFTGSDIDESEQVRLQEALRDTKISWRRDEEELEYSNRLHERGLAF